MKRLGVPGLVVLGCVLVAPAAFAHLPVCACRQQQRHIVCEGGYGDGSAAAGVRIDVIADDESILVSGKLDADSRFSFEVPEREFYVLMDAGPGEIVELEWRDIEGFDADWAEGKGGPALRNTQSSGESI